MTHERQSHCGSADLRLPDDLRTPLLAHLAELRKRYLARGWAGRVGFGKRPALIVIDLAVFWTQPRAQIGTEAEPVLQATLRMLDAARNAKIPVFFTTYAYDPSDPPSPQNKKLQLKLQPGDERLFELDPRLAPRLGEKLIRKRYASAFKGTNLHEMLASLGIDTLIVTGISTSHCVYATCRDATDSVRVIVPREAVGERCEIMHEVNLLDIDIDLGDVMPLDDVIVAVQGLEPRTANY
ncbi:N-carbamoylsarcosine amidase [Anatilimnocola aggregata]|uniref:N-carbamoylsarcosine amidase n=1 Tax=Anatilimnocola aggregata TaxID=2528021 RepID=A0A517YDA3_9BACT|nr:isochorismatase family protein [Anatilimnocola aggregata]QDU28216.1 N-carbamoylsarcosine amidase [Anatilimnocola aggregata]